MRIPELGIAVPVRSAADAEPEPLRDPREPLLDGRGVARMPHLAPIQPLFLDRPDWPFAAVLAKMGGERERAHAVDEVGHLAQPRQRLLDVRRPAAPEIAPERVVDVRGDAARDEGARHMRSADRAVSPLTQYVRDLDLHAEPLQPGDHLLGAAVPGGPRADEKLLQPRLARGQEVAEHMQLAPRRFDAELAPGNHPDG